MNSLDAVLKSRRNEILASVCIVVAFISFGEFYASTGNVEVTGTGTLVASVASILFWVYITALMLLFPLRNSVESALQLLRRKGWADGLFGGYIIVHLVIYGVLLELMLATIYKLNLPGGAPPVVLFVSGNYVYQPHNLFTALETISLNPSLSILFPFELGVVLGPFSFVSAIIIGLLVMGNISLLLRLKGPVKRLGLSLALPAVGVAGGASCCISIPALLAIASPAVYAFLLLPVGIFVQNILYFGLPLLVIVVLALNIQSLKSACPT